MKTKLVSLMLFISIHTFGQFTGTGTSEAPRQNTGQGNTFVAFIVGLSSPAGEFKANDLTKDFSQAVGVKPGWVFGMQGQSDFNLNLGTPALKAGLNFDVTLTFHQVNWEKWIANARDFQRSPFMIVDFRLGPSLGYRHSDNLAADIFFNLGPAMGLGGSGDWTSGTTTTNFSSTSVAFGLKTGLGASVRFSGLLIGVQYCPLKLKFKYDLEVDTPTTTASTTTREYTLPMNTLQVYVGFGKKR